jgi:parallel beta-helix repeat protein
MLKRVLIFVTCAALWSCDAQEATDAPGSTLPEGCDHFLAPGGDDHERLQTVLIEAEAAQTVCLAKGTFYFLTELSISVDNLTLKGAGRALTVLDFSAQDLGANGIHVTSDGVTVEAFTVLDTPGDGIRASAVEGITFRAVAVLWTAEADPGSGAYGFYPVESTDVLIEGCVVRGSSDAGIYVGQSRRILVRDNEAHGNVGGIQIENSVDAEVVDNHAHDNSAGILVFSLPELPFKDGERTKVHRNLVENNNLGNFSKPGAIISVVPAGTGIIVLSTDNNEITDNIIRGNESVGVALVSYISELFGAYDDPEFDRFSEGNYVHHNTYEANGTAPHDIVAGLVPDGLDILFDGCVREPAGPPNCFFETQEIRFQNLDLCGIDQPTTEMESYVCQYEPLPARLL